MRLFDASLFTFIIEIMPTALTQKKRILFTTVHPAPYMDEWFRAFDKDFFVTVIYEKPKDSHKTWHSYKGYPGLYSTEISFIELRRIVKEQDFIMMSGWHNRFLMSLFLIAITSHKRIAMFTDYSFHTKRFADLFKNLFLYRKLDFIFCASQSTCEMIEGKYASAKGKSRLFPYMANIPAQYEILPSRIGGKVKVLIANNFFPRKGYSILFKALELLSADIHHKDSFVFTIVGHGEEYNKYFNASKALNLDITFKGWVEVEDYYSLMDDTDVYIHSSLEEPFGIPPVDAMSRGKVVVSSDGVRSMDRFIEDGVTGFIYPSFDYKKLYNILISLNPSLFNEIGIKAREKVLKTYSISQNIKVLKDIFKD